MLKNYVLIVLLICSFCTIFAQSNYSNSNSRVQYGVSTKVSIELGARFGNVKSINNRFFSPAYKVSVTGGVGYIIGNDFEVFPAIHSGVLLFNKGSIGANQSLRPRQVQFHYFFNGHLTAMLDEKDFTYSNKNVPFYHFSEHTANPLQNPFKSSLSFGANLIFVQNNNYQWTGFFNANIASTIQVSYYNDGGPILGWPGDNRDRYYTGGVVLSYHGMSSDKIDLIELSYHKYTGYVMNAFDVADKLQIDFLNYSDLKQFSYNQQRWRLNFSNTNDGFGGSASVYNYNKWDFQDWLHFNTNVPYHPDYYRGYRIMLGARHEYNKTYLPK